MRGNGLSSCLVEHGSMAESDQGARLQNVNIRVQIPVLPLV